MTYIARPKIMLNSAAFGPLDDPVITTGSLVHRGVPIHTGGDRLIRDIPFWAQRKSVLQPGPARDGEHAISITGDDRWKCLCVVIDAELCDSINSRNPISPNR
jgi:hypothetical protein